MKNVIILFFLFSFLATGQIVQAQSSVSLNEKGQAAFQYMLEEEKLARDVYIAFHEKWSNTVFQKISSAEQRHMDEILTLAKQHNLVLPEGFVSEDRGTFQNRELQGLYHSLVEKGSKSFESALEVGAQIEELDIKDLRTAMETTTDPAVLKIYTQLEQASERHLQSFVKNLNKVGVTYQSVFLSPSDYEAIVKVESSGKQQKGKACCSADKGNKKGAKGKAACCSAEKGKGEKGKACCSEGKGKKTPSPSDSKN